MAVSAPFKRLGPYVSRLAGSEYAHDELRDAAQNLRAAYDRATSRKAAKAAEDKKLYRRVRRGVASLSNAAQAIATGREKPRRRWPKRLGAVTVLGVAAAVARATVNRGATPTGDTPDPAPATSPTAA